LNLSSDVKVQSSKYKDRFRRVQIQDSKL